MGPKSRFVRVVCKYTIILLLHYTHTPTFRALSSFAARPKYGTLHCVIWHTALHHCITRYTALCYMIHCITWHTALYMTHWITWGTASHNTLRYMTHCVIWHIALLDALRYMTHRAGNVFLLFSAFNDISIYCHSCDFHNFFKILLNFSQWCKLCQMKS